VIGFCKEMDACTVFMPSLHDDLQADEVDTEISKANIFIEIILLYPMVLNAALCQFVTS
jgi:hypothetical protein